MDHNQGRRGHFHRGRRGPDRRGPERRQGPPPDQGNRPERTDRVDVEQIMRDIRMRIAQRSGIELSNQQIQELAARRLEAILDPRDLKPELLDQLRRTAGERPVSVEVVAAGSTQSYPFDEATLYDSPNALLRFIRRLLQPLLRMMFNPTPIAHALALQSRLNAEIAAREADRDRRQAEWNALHYELVQRMVTGGAEMMVGAINDPTFGHVVVCGSGGVLIDLLADSSCRLYPVTDQDADEMVASLKGVRLLRGFRGNVPADEDAFRDAILRISALVGMCPEIEELDVNPLAVLPGGVSALDVRVRVAWSA